MPSIRELQDEFEAKIIPFRKALETDLIDRWEFDQKQDQLRDEYFAKRREDDSRSEVGSRSSR